MKVKSGLLVFCCFVPIFIMAQSSLFTKKQKQIYWDAETYYELGDYPSVIKELSKIEEVDLSYSSLYFMLGDAYFAMDDYKKAFSYLKRGSDKHNDGLYQMAYIKLYQEELDSARFYLSQFQENWNSKKSRVQAYELSQLQENIKNAEHFLANPEIVNIINLGGKVNTENDEYVPLVSADEELLVFTSRRVKEGEALDPFGKAFEDIYSSVLISGTNQWGEASLVEGDVNTESHDACVGLSPSGSTMYIFKTNENLIGGDLYESLKLNGRWTTPIIMGDNINNVESIEPSASISLDGKTFYFSSNRAGGYGGFDIYRVKKLPNGEWSLPLNLGPTINTPFDEDAPFVHPNGKHLYFSSKGHENMGGYDVFVAELKDEKWAQPMNLGVPTNSTKDDVYFTISVNERHGYYSSDKEGGYGGQDLYMIDYLEKELRQSVISGKIMLNGEPINADISLIDSESGDLIGVYTSNAKTGKFIFLVDANVEYELIVEGDTFEEYSDIISYSIEDLLKKQNKVIQLNTPASE